MHLADGTNYEGRVEIAHKGEWGTVCADEWDIDNAKVVCRSLGFLAAEEAVTDPLFGSGSGPVVLSDVDCDGDESDILRLWHPPSLDKAVAQSLTTSLGFDALQIFKVYE